MNTVFASVLMAATVLTGVAHAATNLTFDDLANGINPNHYRSPDGLYKVEAFSADVNVADLVRGNPAPSVGIPIPAPTVSYMDMGIRVSSWTIGTYFHWDEATLFGDPLYGTEYHVMGMDLDGKVVFNVHAIVQGVQVVTTPKADAEIAELAIFALPAATSPSTVGRYGAVDNVKLRAKGEKPLPEQKTCTRRRGC